MEEDAEYWAREIDDAYWEADMDPCRCHKDEVSCPHCNKWDEARKLTRKIIDALCRGEFPS